MPGDPFRYIIHGKTGIKSLEKRNKKIQLKQLN